ncbi:MAG: hypothetical protein ACP5K7_04955, partial [Verrucomicrobiia bacterium]
MNYLKILELSKPETFLSVTVFVVLAFDLFFCKGAEIKKRLLNSSIISVVGCIAALVSIGSPGYSGGLDAGILVSSSLTNWIKIVLILCC